MIIFLGKNYNYKEGTAVKLSKTGNARVT